MFRRCAIFVALLALATSATAAVRARSFDAALMLQPDGSLFVEETISFIGTQQTFSRLVPLRKSADDTAFLVRVMAVEDDAGHALSFTTQRRGDVLALRVNVPVANLRIKYLVPNAVRFTGAYDELAWVASDADISTDAADVRLALPASAAGQFRAQAYLRSAATGAPVALWSSNGALPVDIGDAQVQTHSPGPLRAGVAVAIDVAINERVLRPPSVGTRGAWYLEENRIVFLPLAVVLLMFALRRITRPQLDSIVPAYEPPDRLTPAEAGALIDDRVDPRDLASTLVDLAVRGYVRFDHISTDNTGSDFKITLLRAADEQITLAPHERSMLFHAFYGGHWTELSSLRLRLPSLAPLFTDQVWAQLRAKGLYRTLPYSRWILRNSGFVLAAAITLAAERSGLIALERAPILSLCVLVACAACVLGLAPSISPKTRDGWRAWAKVRGFDDFLNRVDSDRMERLTPDLYEKYLPYAMAFGVERGWTAAFDDIAVPQPDWFGADGGITDPALFRDSLHAFFEHTLDRVRSARAPRITRARAANA
jgi:hypothetical protein